MRRLRIVVGAWRVARRRIVLAFRGRLVIATAPSRIVQIKHAAQALGDEGPVKGKGFEVHSFSKLFICRGSLCTIQTEIMQIHWDFPRNYQGQTADRVLALALV